DAAPVDAGEQVGDVEVNGNKLSFSFAEARHPGVYEFVLTRKEGEPDKAPPGGAAAEKARQETLSYAYNGDALSEGGLRRATRDDLESVAPNVPLHTPESQTYAAVLKEKKSDLSESFWLFVLFLAVLAAEQAMAVRLSYHTRGERIA